MEISILKMAMEHLQKEVNQLKEKSQELEQQVSVLLDEKQSSKNTSLKQEQGDLLSMKQVLSLLGICYNTLQSIIKKGLIFPIHITQRRVMFRSANIQEYIDSQTVRLEG